MKNVFLAILTTLLLASCKSKPVKTETRVYELTYIDGKTETWTIKNVNVKTKAIIISVNGAYCFCLPPLDYVYAVIRFKRVK